jgi:hypothetical protein
MADQERGFNTGEYVPGQGKKAETPAEIVAEAGGRLVGILNSAPLSDPEMLARSGGPLGMVSLARIAFEDALYELALGESGNKEVFDYLNQQMNTFSDLDEVSGPGLIRPYQEPQ